jgi:CheY-like chemotaxis protein
VGSVFIINDEVDLMMSPLPGGDSMARSAGADAFLPKPFDAERLIDRVSELISRAPDRTSAGGAEGRGA